MSVNDPQNARLRLALSALGHLSGALHVALFAPRGPGLTLVANHDVDHVAMELATAAWARKRERLERGEVLPYGGATIWPLFDGPTLVAFVYLSVASDDFPTAEMRRLGADIVERLRGVNVPTATTAYVARGMSLAEAQEEAVRDAMITVLERLNGNATAAAAVLGISRETLYSRADRLSIDIPAFRKRTRRGR